MKNYKLLLSALIVAAISCVMFSCKKSSQAPPPTITIADTSKSVSESAGTASVTIHLSQAQSQNIQLNVQISGTAILNGDYSVDSASSITIPAGSTSASVNFTIFNDAVVESDKTIQVKFTSSGNVTLTNANATITIKDDDVSHAANGLQTDLVWDAGSAVDLDIFLVDDVVITNNEISYFNIVRYSANPTGFETVPINNNDSDGLYYLAVYYNTGARTVNYSLISNGPGITNAVTNDVFAASDVGSAFFYGPITKSGSTYSRAQTPGGIYDISKMKAYHYRGKVMK